MARAAIPGRLTWRRAQVVSRVEETARVRTLALHCPGWPGHLPGQHLDVRLTAADGYQAQRSYSVATPADGPSLSITVERIDDGEVSPYLVDEVRAGEWIEIRGPIGGYFAWRGDEDGPLLLVGGGSGVVPLMAILRARDAGGPPVPTRMLVSARSIGDVIYRDELHAIAARDADVEVVETLTRVQPPGWTGGARRVDRDMLAALAWPADAASMCFVCGPTGFVETVADALVELGHSADRIRTERFGPTASA